MVRCLAWAGCPQSPKGKLAQQLASVLPGVDEPGGVLPSLEGGALGIRRAAREPPSYWLIDQFSPFGKLVRVRGATTKVTVNLPTDTLRRARTITGRGITDTILAGLKALERQERRSALRALKGRVPIDLDLDETRR